MKKMNEPTILVIEENLSELLALISMLSEHCEHVIPCVTISEAMQHINGPLQEPDLVMTTTTDLGIEVAWSFRHARPETPIVFMIESESELKKIKKEINSTTLFGFIKKPLCNDPEFFSRTLEFLTKSTLPTERQMATA